MLAHPIVVFGLGLLLGSNVKTLASCLQNSRLAFTRAVPLQLGNVVGLLRTGWCARLPAVQAAEQQAEAAGAEPRAGQDASARCDCAGRSERAQTCCDGTPRPSLRLLHAKIWWKMQGGCGFVGTRLIELLLERADGELRC